MGGPPLLPSQGLSPWSTLVLTGISPEVSELLMEAQLLQVSLPEIQELYQTLLAKPSPVQQADHSPPVRPGSEKVGIGVWCLPCLAAQGRDTVFDPGKDADHLPHSLVLTAGC